MIRAVHGASAYHINVIEDTNEIIDLQILDSFGNSLIDSK